MEYEKRLTGFIIHGFAVAHAVAAAALAQTLVGDEVVLTTLTISMILVIARINKRSWEVGDALSFIGILAGTYLGSRGAVLLVKWIPLIGNAANAITTFAVTEIIGWATFLVVKEGKEPKKMTKKEIAALKQQAREIADEEHEKSKQLYESMNKEDKKEYEHIMKLLNDKKITDDVRDYLLQRIEEIVKRYVQVS